MHIQICGRAADDRREAIWSARMPDSTLINGVELADRRHDPFCRARKPSVPSCSYIRWAARSANGWPYYLSNIVGNPSKRRLRYRILFSAVR
jgi:hypothetical protein